MADAGVERIVGWLLRHEGAAVFGVGIGIIGQDFVDDLGLEFAVRTFDRADLIEFLYRIAVDIEAERTAQRGEIGLADGCGQPVAVGGFACRLLQSLMDQHGCVIALHRIGAGHAVVGGFISLNKGLVGGIVERGRP